MNGEEKKTIEDMNRFANGIDMSCVTARQMQIILNLIEKLQKENEKYKRLSEMNLKNAEEFKNNMCEHRCLLKSENEELQRENEELKKFITEGITVAPHSTYKNYRLDFLRENFVSKRRIKNEIAKMQEEYNKLDKKIELYLKKEEKTMQELYENRDNVGELQMIAYFIQTLQEILEESEE